MKCVAKYLVMLARFYHDLTRPLIVDLGAGI